MLRNLLRNAINYTPVDGLVTISAGSSNLNDRKNVWIRVEDTGPGIDEEDLPHIFERFYRGRSARESGAPGTGLGLAICKEIMERHSGHIDVVNIPGKGSAFTVYFQALIADESTEIPENIDAERA